MQGLSVCPTSQIAYGCTCGLDCAVWTHPELRVAIYPQAGLVACHGLLVRYVNPTNFVFGLHKINESINFRVRSFSDALYICITELRRHLAVTHFIHVQFVGLQRVRRVQRWWRGRLWKWSRDKHLAFMMAAHARLGSASKLMQLDGELMRMCCAR
jgi:hypothetical protein